MKELKKLKLINWHYFYNIMVDFKTINFLTGENASGKSTLIDAMQVVLLGDTAGRIFNKAANEKSGRTLKGYLKGEVGDDGEGQFNYLRKGRFTSYIALEFYDNTVNKSFVLGIVFDVFEDGTEQHKFFTIEDKIPENQFIGINNVPFSQKELADYLFTNYAQNEYKFYDTNAQYQMALKEKLGNIKDKYFSLFKKAVSFTPITNIEQFITEYVCDVNNDINVDSMRENIKQYKRLEIEAQEMHKKITKLEKIQTCYQDYQNLENELKLEDYISKRSAYQVNLEALKNLQKDVENNEVHLKEINVEINEIEAQIASFTKKKEALIASKVSSSSYQLNKELTDSKEKAEENIKQIEKNINQDFSKLLSYINNFSNQVLRMNAGIEAIDEKFKHAHQTRFIELSNLGNSLYKIASDFKKALENKDNLSKEMLFTFKDSINKFKDAVSDHYGYFKSLVASELMKLNQEKNNYSETSASTGGKLYDYQLIQIRNQLRNSLKDHYDKDVEVSFYADLVDIKDKKWVNAIEGFIASQKVNMFVEEEYYETASKFLSQILKRNNYFYTGLVDAERLRKANIHCEDNSLAEEIITDHEGARDYTNFLLGRMIKCNNLSEARASGRGITPDCDGYRNFATFVIPTRNYQYKLIGRKVSPEDQKAHINEINKKINSYNLIKEFILVLASICKEETLNNNETDTFALHLEEAEILPVLRRNLKQYEEEIKVSTGTELSFIQDKIERLEQDILSLSEEHSHLLESRGNLIAQIKTIQNEKIPYQIEEGNKKLNEIKEAFSEEFINEIASPTFDDELAQGKSLAQIKLEYDELYSKIYSKSRSIKKTLNELRKDYVVEYNLSYNFEKDDNDDFEKELHNLKDVKLPTYQEKILDAYNKATKEFKDDFIFKLKTSIEMVKNQIAELNEALKTAKFGSDTYQFTVTPAPQYRDYYNMIVDDLLLTYGEDENLYLEKYRDIMNNLFKLIGDVSSNGDQNSLIAQNVEKFTDYRTYLLFDLMVSKDGGKPYSLGRNIKKASGGETQTPFYISILASFSQLYRVNSDGLMSNTVRIVIFDEAFSKMDRARIIESIKILKSFGLQVIISAPPEKVSDISKLVDNTLVVMRLKGHSDVAEFNNLSLQNK